MNRPLPHPGGAAYPVTMMSRLLFALPAVAAAGLAAVGLSGPSSASDPGSGLTGWDVIQEVGLREVGTDDDWSVEKTFPAGFEDGAETFSIEGYAVIFAAQADLQEIMLVPDAAQCPFCGSGEGYGPVLEVVFDRPVAIDVPEEAIRVEGRLEAVDDPRTFQAFRMTGARLVDPAS